MSVEITVRSVQVAETRPLRQSVLRPHETLDELAAREPAGAFAAGAFLDGELVPVGMVLPDGDGPGDWRVRGMATAPRARGRGAGTAVLDALIAHARAHGATRIWCNARVPALNLYLRAGFVTASERFELPDIGPHFKVELRVT